MQEKLWMPIDYFIYLVLYDDKHTRAFDIREIKESALTTDMPCVVWNIFIQIPALSL